MIVKNLIFPSQNVFAHLDYLDSINGDINEPIEIIETQPHTRNELRQLFPNLNFDTFIIKKDYTAMVFNIDGVEIPHEKYYKKYVEIDNYFGELLVRGDSMLYRPNLEVLHEKINKFPNAL